MRRGPAVVLIFAAVAGCGPSIDGYLADLSERHGVALDRSDLTDLVAIEKVEDVLGAYTLPEAQGGGVVGMKREKAELVRWLDARSRSPEDALRWAGLVTFFGDLRAFAWSIGEDQPSDLTRTVFESLRRDMATIEDNPQTPDAERAWWSLWGQAKSLLAGQSAASPDRVARSVLHLYWRMAFPPGALGKTDAPAVGFPKSDPAHVRQRRVSGVSSELASGSESSSSGKRER